MRVSLKWALLAFVISYLLYFVVKIVDKVNHKKATAEQIQTVPKFTCQTTTNRSFSNKLLLGKATILIYFDPACEHCQQEARAFHRNVSLLKQAQIVWLSSEPLKKLQRFAKEFGLESLPTVTVAHIPKEAVYHTFGFTTVPTLLIYSAEGKLVKQYKGETKLEALIPYLY